MVAGEPWIVDNQGKGITKAEKIWDEGARTE
jgi:hypothetical protein